jgi:hypothetical protein
MKPYFAATLLIVTALANGCSSPNKDKWVRRSEYTNLTAQIQRAESDITNLYAVLAPTMALVQFQADATTNTHQQLQILKDAFARTGATLTTVTANQKKLIEGNAVTSAEWKKQIEDLIRRIDAIK